jgi:hypothetical protein
VTRPGRAAGAWLDAAVAAAVLGLGVLIVIHVGAALSSAAPHRPIAADPLDEAALARLGFTADRHGERFVAEALVAFAGRRSWRDRPVQAWLLQRAVEHGDWTSAMAHADALLRTDSKGVLRPQLFHLLDVIAADEASRPAVIGRLRSAPWWRESWLVHLASVAASPSGAVTPDAARSIVTGLAGGPRPLMPAEYLPYVQMRLDRGDYAQAERDWGALARRADAEALLRDPNFQEPANPGPFDWSHASGVGASSEVEQAEGASRALRVDYDGFSPSLLPGQLLVLPPGVYRFVWRERFAGPPRLAWRVRCLGPAPRTLAQAAPGGDPAWRDRVLEFATTTDCAAQKLELAPQPGERRDEVTAWFAAVSLSPSPGTPQRRMVR